MGGIESFSRGRHSHQMNAGELTIDWLRRVQLLVDEEWSVNIPNGFIWWAERNAQRIEVVGTESNADGEQGYLVRVKTEVLRNVVLTDKTLAAINLLMSTASMAGPVYDATTRVLSFSSLVRVHERIREWMSKLVSVAAMQQIVDAHLVGKSLPPLVGEFAESRHPANGLRTIPDELAVDFIPLVASAGAKASQWSATEFKRTVDKYMQMPPSLGATSGGQGLTVEFPFGDGSSLCRMLADQAHPRIGNGLFLLQSFPVDKMSDSNGTRLALELNSQELEQKPTGYGFGSYCYRDACIHFTGFVPNLAYREGLLPNFYFACAGRARAMALRFKNDDWSGATYRPKSAVERLLGLGHPDAGRRKRDR
jgi:hypothetical protein